MMARRSGFTLLELVVVLAIMGLLLCLLWPRFERIVATAAVEEAGRLLMDDLQTVREEARLVNGAGILRTEARGYRTYLLTKEGARPLCKRRFAHGVQWGYGDGNVQFVFLNDASCVPSRHHWVRIQAANAAYYDVTVAQTGRIRKGRSYD